MTIDEFCTRKNCLGCGDGPAGFNAELTKRGSHVISVAWMERSLRSAIQVPPAMIIVWAIAIYRKANLPRLIAMQKRVLAETMIKAKE